MVDSNASTSSAASGRVERETVALSADEKHLLEQAAKAYGFNSAGEFMRFVGTNVARAMPADAMPQAEPLAYPRWLRPVVRGLLYTAVGWCLIAWGLIWVEVETVLGTGPALTILGILIMAAGWKVDVRAVLIGAAHCGICVMFVLLVNLYVWSPADAHQPFVVMGVIYIVALIPITIWVAHTLPPPGVPFGTCAHCGYLLWGLSEPRCPECGTGFDTSMLPALQATPPPR
jgi:hypothetical protein